jgi:hypothetical protein
VSAKAMRRPNNPDAPTIPCAAVRSCAIKSADGWALPSTGQIPGLKRVEMGAPLESTKARSQGWQTETKQPRRTDHSLRGRSELRDKVGRLGAVPLPKHWALPSTGQIPGLKRVEMGAPLESTKARSQGWQTSSSCLVVRIHLERFLALNLGVQHCRSK